MNIEEFAAKIIEGSGGLNDYEKYELVVWPQSDRIAAAIWTIRCLANSLRRQPRSLRSYYKKKRREEKRSGG